MKGVAPVHLLCFALACSPLPDATTGGETGTSSEPGSTTTVPTTTDPPDTSDTTSATTGEPATTDGNDTRMAPPGCEEIVIADPSLEAAIREQLGVPEGPISQEAALALEVLNSNPIPPIETLDGLQCFSNLRSLRLGSVVSDLGPLESLDSLGALELKSSEVTDLSPLIGAPNLSELDLSDTPLSDIGPLATIPTLSRVTLTSTPITDLSPLAGLPKLETLQLDGTHPADLTPLATLPKLQTLRLGGCDLTDIDGLAGAPALRDLTIRDNAIADISVLGGMERLQHLDAVNNLIVDLAPLAPHELLMTLRLDNNSIVSLEPLAGAGWLSELSVDQNPLQGLQGLEDLELGDLSAEAAGLTSLVAVAPTRLRFLRIADNHVTDLAPLAGHTWLQEVHATGNDISSLASIAEAPWVLARCAYMDLEGNPLDAETLATFLPEMCALDMFLKWDGDSCMSWSCPS